MQTEILEPKTATILIVDDQPENIDVLRGLLKNDYTLRVATSGERALAVAQSEPQPDLILLDISMPQMDGFEVCRRLRADLRTQSIPVIFVTALISVDDEARGLALGAVDYVTKPISPAVVEARVRLHLALHDRERHLAHLVEEKTRELRDTRLQIIRRLGRAAEYKDDETGNHVIRMSYYARLLAVAAGLSEHQADVLYSAAPMHDIGKIGIPDGILQKPGKLTPEEWQIMRQHPAIGAGIIGKHEDPMLETARIVALTHHEKWDGTGYPRQLKGEAIPLVGRIVAIADVFDALTSERPYKKAWPVKDAADYIAAQSGLHFDPRLASAFLGILPSVLEVRDRYSDQADADPVSVTHD